MRGARAQNEICVPEIAGRGKTIRKKRDTRWGGNNSEIFLFKQRLLDKEVRSSFTTHG